MNKMYEHRLHNTSFDGLKESTDKFDSMFSDVKVFGGMGNFQKAFSHWVEEYRRLGNIYENYLTQVIDRAPMFEVHSLVVQRKAVNEQNQSHRAHDLIELDPDAVLNERYNGIIKLIKHNAKNNGVIGVLSKLEVDVHLNYTKRLIFFVKKESTDWIPFNNTSLFNDLSVHFIDTLEEYVGLGSFTSMNAGIEPLFQHQETNFYNVNQLHVGNRLLALKAHLVGTDFWIRYKGLISLKIECQVESNFGGNANNAEFFNENSFPD